MSRKKIVVERTCVFCGKSNGGVKRIIYKNDSKLDSRKLVLAHSCHHQCLYNVLENPSAYNDKQIKMAKELTG